VDVTRTGNLLDRRYIYGTIGGYRRAVTLSQGTGGLSGIILIMRCVPINNLTNHFLVGSMMLLRFVLEELYARSFQRDRYLDIFVIQNQLIGGREKIVNDSQFAHWFVSVLYFFLHRYLSLFSNTPLQKF
jgi:hypothetical protein